MCFNCGRSGHVASAGMGDATLARKCFDCGGVGHMARNCPTRAAQSVSHASSSSSANAVASAGKGAAQIFTAAVIGGVRIPDALIDTCSAFSMLSSAMYSRLPSAPHIQPFTCAAPDVVGVGGASAEIRGYVDTPVEIDGTAVHHPMLMVEGLAFPLLIGTDVLRPHYAMFTLDETVPLRLRVPVCDVCREQRTDLPADAPSAPLTACAAFKAVVEPCTTAFIRVRVPRALCKEPNVALEPLDSLLEVLDCAALPSVHAPADSVVYMSVTNPSNRRVEIPTGLPLAVITPVAPACNSMSTAVFSPQLSRVPRFDTLTDSIRHKRPQVDICGCAASSAVPPSTVLTSARAAPLSPDPRAPQLSPVPRIGPRQMTPHADPIPLAPPAAPLQAAPPAAPQSRVPVAPQLRARTIPDSRDSPPFLPFDSLAVLPKQPQRNKHATRKPKRKARVLSPQPIVPALQSTQVPYSLSLMNLRVSAPTPPIAHAALPLLRRTNPHQHRLFNQHPHRLHNLRPRRLLSPRPLRPLSPLPLRLFSPRLRLHRCRPQSMNQPL